MIIDIVRWMDGEGSCLDWAGPSIEDDFPNLFGRGREDLNRIEVRGLQIDSIQFHPLCWGLLDPLQFLRGDFNLQLRFLIRIIA